MNYLLLSRRGGEREGSGGLSWNFDRNRQPVVGREMQ